VADVEVIKTSDDSTVIAGGGVTYRLTVVNHGPSDATAVTATDSLPTALTVTSVDLACTASGHTVRCALGTIAAGKAVTVVITATLDPSFQGTSLANTATATSPVTDPDESNNSSTITTPVETRADLSVTKTSDPAGVTPGSAFAYTIVVNNAGPSTARAVVLSDTVPAGLAVSSASNGCTVKGSAVTCQLGDLPIGQVVVVLHVRLAAGYEGASIVNTATATSHTTDPDPSNNSGTAESPVTALADLAITKTMSPAAPVAGHSVKYVLTVKNNGPSHARMVTITDELPRGLTNVTTTGSTCKLLPPEAPGAPDTPAAGTVQCSTPELAVGGTVTVTVTATVVPGFTGALNNLARVGSATPDPVIANNEAKVTGRTTQSANLSVHKTASASTVIAGHSLVYTIAVHNAGPSSAGAVTITDVLPNGLRLTSTPEHCAANGQKVTCSVGRIDPGTTAQVVVNVLVDPTYSGTSVANTATAQSPTPDPDPNDNTSTVRVQVTPPQPGRPAPELPNTGSDVSPAVLLAALALIAAGVAAIATTRRRRG
ncbi:DUF11 domain-containing protein, partial [Kribbella sp.]|uniref:DUF11 domain-containing protein n=1 Tax=Kribbella sp. TaxID=1871183 RepID=UPI002D2840CC